MSTVNVNTIKPITDDVHLHLQAGGNTQMYLTSAGALSGTGGSITNFDGLGKVLQVKQYVLKNISWSSTSTTFVNTPVSGAITPTSTNSKVIVSTNMMAYGDVGFAMRLSRTVAGGSAVYPVVSDSAAYEEASTFFSAPYHGSDYHTANVHYSYIDSPQTTSEVTYNFQGLTYTGTMYLNRTPSTAAYSAHGTSQITLMEVSDATTGVITG